MESKEFEALRLQMAKDIMRFLCLHPEVMERNQNQEVYKYVRDLRIKHVMKDNDSYEDVAFAVDSICKLEVRNLSVHHTFNQKTLDCFRPGAEKNEDYYEKMWICMMIYKAQKHGQS